MELNEIVTPKVFFVKVTLKAGWLNFAFPMNL